MSTPLLAQVLENYPVNGIDVSLWQDGEQGNSGPRQPFIYWPDVAPEMDFAILKAFEQKKDPEFDYNWAECKRLGLPAMAYCFFRWDMDPAQQVSQFLEATQESTLQRWLDCELHPQLPPPDPGLFTSVLGKWVEIYKQKTGMAVGIYTRKTFIDAYVLPNRWIAECPLWVAHWKVLDPWVPRDWVKAGKTWTMWQYDVSEKNQVNGIFNKSDLDVFHGTREEFETWMGVEKPPEPPGPGGMTLEERVEDLEQRVDKLEDMVW
jgi:GH25 family lysozyme M1 (1,4-beta-N-acetylmuramidase)